MVMEKIIVFIKSHKWWSPGVFYLLSLLCRKKNIASPRWEKVWISNNTLAEIKKKISEDMTLVLHQRLQVYRRENMNNNRW